MEIYRERERREDRVGNINREERERERVLFIVFTHPNGRKNNAHYHPKKLSAPNP